jgi:hypothetical protein
MAVILESGSLCLRTRVSASVLFHEDVQIPLLEA